MERVVEAVATGRVDAGLVKAGLMELMLAAGSPLQKKSACSNRVPATV